MTDRIRGCFLGGAVGDALGAPVEFERIDGIRSRFGPAGIAELAEAGERAGAITDDTQMTLFTAEGLIRARVRAVATGSGDVAAVVDGAYVRWLATQGEPSLRAAAEGADGWLDGVRGLHERRSPGSTCTSALRGPRAGTIDAPLNDSKGCGGVMRIAPAGLMGARYGGDRFDLGCDLAALTHGHPCGYLAAGALAELVGRLADGDALDAGARSRRAAPGGAPAARGDARGGARRAARSPPAARSRPPRRSRPSAGGGWPRRRSRSRSTARSSPTDFAHGVRLAVNHSGDSDSTGAMTGSILGAQLGAAAIPARWIEQLELRAEIEQLIADWLACFGPEGAADLASGEWRRRYPGW